MPTWVIILLVVMFLVLDSIIITTVVGSALAPIKELSVHYPLRPIREPNMRREFESMRVGLAGLGRCVHYTVDREFVHIEPAMIARWFGVRAASLPRKEIHVTGKEPGFKERGLAEVQHGKVRVWIPTWVVAEIVKT